MMQRSKKGKGKKKTQLPTMPPALRGQFMMRVVFRYQKQTTGGAQIPWRCLDNLLVISVSTTSGYTPYTEIRPKSVTMYVPGVVQTSAAGYIQQQVQLNFPAGKLVEDSAQPLICDRKFITAPPTTDKPVTIRQKFDKPYATYDVFSLASMTNSPSCFAISGPIGTIVDFDCVIKLFGDDRTTFPKTNSTTGATTQVPYFNYLDSQNTTGAAGTQILLPIGCTGGQVNSAAWL